MASPKQDPEMAKKFRRRRIFVLVILALLIWGVWAGVNAVIASVSGAFGGGQPSQSSAAQPSANSNPGNTNNQTPTTCLPNGIEVNVFVGDGTSPKASFGASENPKLWFNIVNTSSKSCYFNLGSKVQFYKITSGSEVIWTSQDCDRSQDINARILLVPGVLQSSPVGEWYKVRSSSTGCGADQKPVVTGGASYHIVAIVNGVNSNDVQFVLN
jgi:hypothetical protein